MYLKAEQHPKFNVAVRDIQMKLNAIRLQVNGSWASLDVDGKFGPRTKEAVKAFQIYRNITPASGDIGVTTLKYINEEYKRIPILKSNGSFITNRKSGTKPYYDTSGLSDKYVIFKITDFFSDFTDQLDDFIKDEIKYVTKLGRLDPAALKSHYMSFASKQNTKMKQLKNIFIDVTSTSKSLDYGKANMRSDSIRRNVGMLQKQQAQRAISRNQSSKKILKKGSMDIVEALKKYNLMEKIDGALKSKGLSKTMHIEALKKMHINGGNVKLGGGVLVFMWSLKDILWDLMQVNEWGMDEWRARLKKHCYEFFDDVITAYVSAVIAEVIVAIVLLVTGATLSVGWIAVIVAVVAVLIATFIGMFCDSVDYSFTEKAVEGYEYIGELIMLYI